MVNKQYNVQNLGKNKTKNSNQIDLQTLKQSVIVTSISSSETNDSNQSQNVFERNITQQYYHSLNDSLDGHFDNKHIIGATSMADIVKNSVADETDADAQSQKHLSINDIGRFQYILQMDREMVSLFPTHIDMK